MIKNSIAEVETKIRLNLKKLRAEGEEKLVICCLI